MRVDGITAQDIVKVRVKDRVIYGEVLEVTDGVVRFRPLCPPAGWHSATGRQFVAHWRKTGRPARVLSWQSTRPPLIPADHS